jgi:hypothetical protein
MDEETRLYLRSIAMALNIIAVILFVTFLRGCSVYNTKGNYLDPVHVVVKK